MEKIRKYFGGIDITWPKLIIFAVASAVVTAVLNEIPILHGTSFADIAIAFECWFLFAIIIITNSKKMIEAVLKCFVFFLISQPLIYLIEVPFEPLGWGVFGYYRRWFIFTVLTIPGAAIAYLVKKKNLLSVFVLSVATGYCAYAAVTYARSAAADFPRHLLSAIFCAFLSLFFIFVLLDKKMHRILAIAIVVAVTVVSVFMTKVNKVEELVLDNGTWVCEIEDENTVKVEMTDGNHASVTAKKEGHSILTFTDENGNAYEYYATVSGGGLWIDDLGPVEE